MTKFLRLSLLISFLGATLVGCGESGDGVAEQKPVVEKIEVLGSCLSEASGTCLNYVSLPTGTTKAELKEACDGNSVWSDAICTTENILGQCDVTYKGGRVVTYFYPPQNSVQASETCSNQQGIYKDY